MIIVLMECGRSLMRSEVGRSRVFLEKSQYIGWRSFCERFYLFKGVFNDNCFNGTWQISYVEWVISSSR